MSKRCKRHVGHVLRQRRYSIEFRGDVRRADCLHHLSLHRFHVPAAPSLHGVPWVGSPASAVQWSTLTSCRPRLTRLRSARRFHLAMVATGSPRFLGSPCGRALVSDPGGIVASGPASGGYPGSLLAQRYCLPHSRRRRLPQRSTLSGLIPTARTLAVYASRRRLPDAMQDSLPAGGQPCRSGLSPADFHVRFQFLQVST